MSLRRKARIIPATVYLVLFADLNTVIDLISIILSLIPSLSLYLSSSL
jgi:hypothetical protein